MTFTNSLPLPSSLTQHPPGSRPTGVPPPVVVVVRHSVDYYSSVTIRENAGLWVCECAHSIPRSGHGHSWDRVHSLPGFSGVYIRTIPNKLLYMNNDGSRGTMFELWRVFRKKWASHFRTKCSKPRTTHAAHSNYVTGRLARPAEWWLIFTLFISCIST